MYTIFPNLNRRIDPGQPETRWKHELLNRREFRQALSLAIDRRAIIHAEFNDFSVPAQIDPGPGSPFHSPELFGAFVEHDPARAGALLDGLGLTTRDGEGLRTFPDGTRMTFFLHTTDYTGPGPAQLIIEDWARVGLRVVLKDQARLLWQARMTTMEQDLSVWTSESEYHPMVQPRNFVPTAVNAFYAPGYGQWFFNGGLFGDPAARDRPGSIEPPPGHPLRRAMELYDAAARTPEVARQAELFREIQAIAAENVWTISIGTAPPQPVVVRRGLRNVPRNALLGAYFASPANAGFETWWLENPADAPATIAGTRREMTEVAPEPRQAAVRATADPIEPGSAHPVGALIRWLVVLAAVLGLAMIALRHPFVGRRLLVMAPTMGVISVAVFVAMNLPPGNYLTARIAELEMLGDEGSVQAGHDLERLFNSDDSAVARYLRWVGLRWFVTFEARDAGLLQGSLGRSMETGRLVNDMVGDRILLTVVVSVLTIAFTWAIAFPAGIYSAVRQHSVGDYVVTFLGFIGMCVPGFLFALILIHATKHFIGIEVGGLLSPEQSIQPGWSVAKVRDLLGHIWVPVVVIGAGGTAGMIRVMRGNLLDELRKPYVTTARAKGMRPLRLLLKYPVRLALSPFISGLGALFPQIISGGAIVAMVLSLPMVGPLLLSALTLQDMYLAGSMLMVLSLLSLAGTLVSDLLLLALDPRIRMEEGGAP
jgi:ABC-type dipeptide/oligopeptide/nickel transport system permease component